MHFSIILHILTAVLLLISRDCFVGFRFFIRIYTTHFFRYSSCTINGEYRLLKNTSTNFKTDNNIRKHRWFPGNSISTESTSFAYPFHSVEWIVTKMRNLVSSVVGFAVCKQIFRLVVFRRPVKIRQHPATSRFLQFVSATYRPSGLPRDDLYWHLRSATAVRRSDYLRRRPGHFRRVTRASYIIINN